AYLIASALCMVIVLFTGGEEGRAELLRPRSVSLGLGVCVLMIEVGVLLMYRSGWPVGRAALIGTLLATRVLRPLAYWIFSETLPLVKVAGLVTCLVGTILLCW